MAVMGRRSPEIGVLNGGIYYTNSYSANQTILSGSYAPQEQLKKNGYRATRHDRMDMTLEDPTILWSPPLAGYAADAI